MSTNCFFKNKFIVRIDHCSLLINIDCTNNGFLPSSRPKKGKSKKQFYVASNKQDEDPTDQQDEEGLAQLIPDIQETANLVQVKHF